MSLVPQAVFLTQRVDDAAIRFADDVVGPASRGRLHEREHRPDIRDEAAVRGAVEVRMRRDKRRAVPNEIAELTQFFVGQLGIEAQNDVINRLSVRDKARFAKLLLGDGVPSR